MSAVPAAISNLHTAVDAGTAVRVFDGEPIGDRPDDWIAIAWQPDTDEAVSSDVDFASLGAGLKDENFEILCSLEHHSGVEVDPAGCRTATFALLTAVRSAIAADISLGAAVLWARVSSFSYGQDQSGDGVTGLISFRVACRARLTY